LRKNFLKIYMEGPKMSSTAQNEPSHVDLPPQPAMPPPPPLPAQQEPQARVSAAFHVPLSQLSSMSGRQTASPLETPGLVGRNRTGVQFLADLVSDPDRVGYMIEIRRIGPALWENVQLPLGPVGQRLQPMTYLEIYENVRALHGGGDYRIHVIDDMGRVVQQIPFRIDTVTEPPRMNFPTPTYSGSGPTPQYRQLAPGMPGRFGMPGAGAAGEEDELVKLRNEERTVSAQVAVKTRKREAELLERRWQDEEEAARERKDKKQLEPVLAMNQQIQTIERQMAQQTAQFMQALQQQQQAANQQFQQLLLTLTNKKEDNSGQMIMVESLKASQNMMTTLVTTMMAASNTRSQESVEQVRAKAEHEHKFMEMMLRMQQGGGSKYEKLVESLVMAQVNKPQDSVQQAIQLLEMGRKQTMDMLEFRDERGGAKDDEFDYDPEAGVMGNVGKLIFGLLRGLMKGGGIKDIGAIMQALNKTDPSQVQTSDLKHLAERLEQQYGHQFQLPSGGQQQVPPALRQVAPKPQVQTNAPRTVLTPFDDEIVEEDGVAAAAAVAHGAVVVTPPPQVQIAEDEEEDAETPDERLRDRVSEMLRIALVDLTDGVRAPEWVDFALDKLNEGFLDLLVAAKDDAERVTILQEKADPVIFQQVYSMLVDEQNRSRYEKFINGLHEIVAEHAKERNGAVLVAGA
jgi:hypothetical protein